MNKRTPNGYDSLYLSNVNQRKIESSPETKLNKIDDESVQSITPSTPKEAPQIPIQTEAPLSKQKMSSIFLNPQRIRKH